MARKMKEPTDRELSTLATFRITAGNWYDFGQLCDRIGISASEALLIYIEKSLKSGKLNLDTVDDSALMERMTKLEQRVANLEKKSTSSYLVKAS